MILDQINKLKQQLKQLSNIQVSLLLLIIAIFSPIIITIIYVIFLFIYLLKTKEIQSNYVNEKINKYLIAFSILSFLTSIFHSNIKGIIISITFFICFNIIFVYKKHADKNLFYLIIKAITIMSLFAFLVGIFQFISITLNSNSEHILIISDSPEQRVRSVFLNANYYAAILEFVILLALYKMFLVKDKESSFAYYLTVVIMNVFMLYLTGCRTAWITLFITIPIMFLFQRKYYIGVSLFIISLIGFYLTLSFEIFPRLDSLTRDFHIRLEIWSTSFQEFLAHPLFGLGPFSYEMIYNNLGGPPTVHAHSIYFDSLLSYGLVGTTIIIICFLMYSKVLFTNYKKENYSFAIGCILAVAIHGLADLTILNIQVGLLFLIIISSIHINDFD